LASVLVISGCATAPDASTSRPPPVPVHAPSSVEEPNDGRISIEGKLRAHDDTALRRAEVGIRRVGFTEPEVTAVVDGEGRFHVEVPPGVYTIAIAAVDHRPVLRTTVVADDLRVEGRLGTHERSEPGDALEIRGELLDATGKAIGSAPSSAARVADRVYRLDLSGKPEGAVALRYQIMAPSGGRTYNGPVADRYENDGGGDFWSIIDVSGKQALDVDLDLLPASDRVAQLQWTGETAPTAALLGFRNHWLDPIDEVRRRMPRTDGRIATMTDELRTDAAVLATKARAEVDATADPAVQAMLRLEHLTLFGLLLGTTSDPEAMRIEMGWILDHLSPTDPHLALLLNLDNFTFLACKDAHEAFLARADSWLERRAREHPEPATALGALEQLLHAAERRNDDTRVAELYALVGEERFRGTYTQTRLQQPFPPFDFAALGDEGRRITSSERTGRLYLIEFWATWCGPCVVEMPKLHAAYAAINGAKPGKGRGEAGLRRLKQAKRPAIEFVFVSLDAEPGDVEAFRKQHWSMPWTHAFVGSVGEAEAMTRYGFSGVPTAVLVDETGTILATDMAVRGDALLPALEQALAEPKGTRP
jgi:thiol-disulfide isomerase/thioredoxin